MEQTGRRINDLEILNGLLRQRVVNGNVLYHDEFPDTGYHGYWYTNPTSRGFLGKTLDEARDAINILIDSVKMVQKDQKKGNPWMEKLKAMIK